MRTPPNSTIPHHSVEDREQLPHARHQRHLLGLARLKEALVELLDGGVVAGGDQRSHVQGGPHWSSAAPHLSLAASLPGVAVEGGHPYQGAQTLVSERAQFGQFGQKRASEYRTHAGDAPQERLVRLEDGARFDGLVEVPIGARKLLLKPLHVRPDTLGYCFGSHLEAVVLRDEHLQDLASSGKDCLQSLGFFVGEDARGRTDGRGEAGEYLGIYLVGLGEATGGFGEVS